jgi:cbb3-type cytochrome oxidase subunit 1
MIFTVTVRHWEGNAPMYTAKKKHVRTCFILLNNIVVIVVFFTCQGIFMLVSGYFRLPNDIPKPVWRYPMSYISFHFWALQVK